MTPTLDEKRLLPVREIMVSKVVSTAPSDSLLFAARAMREHHVSGLPVVTTDGKVVGVVSERDIMQELHRSAGLMSYRGVLDILLAFSGATGVDRIRQSVGRLESGTVRDVMSRKPVTAGADDTLQECLRLMRQYSINRLPILEQERMVGIVTRGDVINAMAAADPPMTVRVSVPKAAASGAKKARRAVASQAV
jgi:CBS domain-containing protein